MTKAEALQQIRILSELLACKITEELGTIVEEKLKELIKLL